MSKVMLTEQEIKTNRDLYESKEKTNMAIIFDDPEFMELVEALETVDNSRKINE